MRSPSIRMPWSAFGASGTPSMRRPARTRVRWGGAGWAAMPDPGSATATARPRARRVRHERGDIIPPGVSWEVRNVRRPILSAGDDLAEVEDVDVVARPHDQGHVVVDEQHADAEPLPEAGEQGGQLGRLLGVE